MDMITTLHIKNIGIIDDIVIDLNRGLNVLTGETGAGKTLIIDSLSILSGGRFSKEMIRKGETNSFVEVALYEPDKVCLLLSLRYIYQKIQIQLMEMLLYQGK